MAAKTSSRSSTKRSASRRERTRRKRTAQPTVEKALEQPQQDDEKGFLFVDSYWDDAFASYYDPVLRTCCRIS